MMNYIFRIHLTTLTVHLTSLPSTRIVIVAVPALCAVTKPVAETDAMPVEFDEYVGTRSVESIGRITGSSWYVSPILSVTLVCGIDTDDTGTFTVTVQVAIFAPLSLFAVIVAVPAETPVTFPFGSTLATF